MSRLISWGGNQDGQLGIGSLEKPHAERPTELSSLKDVEVTALSCGDSHTLLVLEDGSVHACGSNEFGQLGHNKRYSRPEKIDELAGKRMVQAATGTTHSLFLADDGQMFSCGQNDGGQLGRVEPDSDKWRIPGVIRLPHFVVQVSCGRNHCIALTDDGLAFAWGDNRYGQLGLGHTRREPEPTCITCMRGVPVAQVTCGGSHSFMLSCSGTLFGWGRNRVWFAWGDNRYGQLGLGHTQQEPEHTCITCMRGMPVAQVTCGGSHSFMLSCSGTLFGWGRNSFGQLGVNDEKDRLHPTLCKSLRQQKVKHVTCGEDHSAALTDGGGLFTFGAGTFGQLGHGSKTKEILPRKVLELMGSCVTQVSCGRRHTLAYVANSGRLFVFGSGANHQLGISSTEVKTTPTQVAGPFVVVGPRNSAAMDTDDGPLFAIKRTAAGGDHCFVWATVPQSSIQAADFCCPDPARQIKSLSPGLICDICKLRAGDNLPAKLEQNICKTLSSAACMNSSFLMRGDAHYGSGSKNHGVDMGAVRENLSKLLESKHVVAKQKMLQAIEGHLLPSLPKSPPDVEALRVYLILPHFPFFEQPKYYSSLLEPFARSIVNLDKPASKVLGIWWGSFNAAHFLRVVYVYKETVIYILQLPEPKTPSEVEMRRRALLASLEILKKLSDVSEASGHIVDYHKFYISSLQEKVNLREEYIMWLQQQGQHNSPSRLMFCDYPFTFDAAAKTLLLQTDALMQMQNAIEDVQRRNIQSLFLPINPVNPCLVFYVSRDNIVRDTIQQLMNQGSADLKKPLKVIFSGEEAMDEGGVRKEFFMLLLRELLDPKYGMFKTYDESSGLQWFAPFTFEEKQMYLLIGCLCGLAIYNSVIIQLDFPVALYKKLLNRPLALEDLVELMPTVGRGLEELLSYEGDDIEDVYCLNFEVSHEYYGEMRTVELVKGGKNVHVKKENRQEYVDKYVEYIFLRSVEEQFAAFNSGFHKVCGGRVLELFHPKELKAMVVGNENYDFHELEKNTVYKGDYHRYHQTIKFFWDVFHDMSLDDKKNFLLFLTGSNKIPIMGMKYVKIFIQPMNCEEKFLPVAHTCFNLLDLPRYSTKERLKVKLLQAIQQIEGFGLV